MREDVALRSGGSSHDKNDHRSASDLPPTDSKKHSMSHGGQSAIYFGEELQFWPEKENQPLPRFSHISAMYSELVAVNTTGQLCQWRWNDSEPYNTGEVSKCYPGRSELEIVMKLGF